MAVGLSKPIQMAVAPVGPRRRVQASRSEPVAPVKQRVPFLRLQHAGGVERGGRAEGLGEVGFGGVDDFAGGVADFADEVGFRAFALVAEGGEADGHFQRGGGDGAAEEVLGIEEGAGDAAAFGDALDFGGADLAAGLHGFAGQHEFAALGGGGGDEGLEGGAEIAAGAGAVEARVAVIRARRSGRGCRRCGFRW